MDAEKIGIIGICGWGGFALNTAALDTRIKATVVSTMYDMTRVAANGYFDADDSEEARYETKKALNAARTEAYRNGRIPKSRRMSASSCTGGCSLLCQRLQRIL